MARKEIEMNLKKIFFVKVLVLLLILSFVGPALSQSKQGKTKIYSGVIEWVSGDFKYMSVDEHKVLITPGTKVLDELGHRLTIYDLRRGLKVVVEMIRHSDGSTEKRIVIKR
jgi:hypothetical protein